MVLSRCGEANPPMKTIVTICLTRPTPIKHYYLIRKAGLPAPRKNEGSGWFSTETATVGIGILARQPTNRDMIIPLVTKCVSVLFHRMCGGLWKSII